MHRTPGVGLRLNAPDSPGPSVARHYPLLKEFFNAPLTKAQVRCLRTLHQLGEGSIEIGVVVITTVSCTSGTGI
jgi:hypothetical protein